jgi:hypothetical protein
MILDFPNNYPVSPGETKFSTFANVSGATIVVTITNAINGEYIQIGSEGPSLTTTAGVSQYTFTGINFNSAFPSTDNTIVFGAY